MGFRNLLIITDNPKIAKRFETEVLPVISNEIRVSFSCSPFTNIASFNSLINAVTQVNLKKQETLRSIFEEFDLVLSIHCKQLFPICMVRSIKCINVHPGYNPINRGWYPQVFAIINNTKIGATIHEIDEKLDHGNIIDRAFVEKHDCDTSLTLYERVVEKEIELLKKNINKIVENKYQTIKPEIEGKLYLKADFNKICKLDLNENLSMKEAIDKLRALTHGDYKNAFFIDKATGNKIYVSINLEQNE